MIDAVLRVGGLHRFGVLQEASANHLLLGVWLALHLLLEHEISFDALDREWIAEYSVYQGLEQAQLGFGGLVLDLGLLQSMTEPPQKIVAHSKSGKGTQK